MSCAFGHNGSKTIVSDNVNCSTANIEHARITTLTHVHEGGAANIPLRRLAMLSDERVEKMYKIATTMAKGDRGETGPTGPAGQRGPPGRVGIQGIVGVTGPTGPQGDTGVGVQGPTGPTGCAGCMGPMGFPGPSTIGGAPIIITDLLDGHVLKYIASENIWKNVPP